MISMLGYTVVTLAAARMLWWLLAYIAGDVREVVRHRQIRRSGQRRYRPKVSVVVAASDTDAAALEDCLRSVYASTYRPAEVLVLAGGDKVRAKATAYRRKHRIKHLRVIRHTAPVDTTWDTGGVFLKYAKGSLGVLVSAHERLDAGALDKGVRYFRDQKLQLLTATAVVWPGNSVLRALVCLQQIIVRHIRRAYADAAPTGRAAVFFRRRALRGKPERSVFAPDVYVYQEGVQPFRLLAGRGVWAAVWAAVELAAVGVVLYVYGVERGLFMLSFVAVLAWLLIAVAVWSYKGAGRMDKLSLLLLAPFVYVSYAVGAALSLRSLLGKFGRHA